MMENKRASLNYKEINLLLAELDLRGAKIQDFLQPRPDHLILRLFDHGERKSLLFVMSQNPCRFHLTTAEYAKPARPQRFVSFLRAHAGNSTLISIEHVSEERILKIMLEQQGVQSILWVRLWAGAPNIIFTDMEGRIGDALFRRPKRGEISGGFYDPAAYFAEHPPREKNADQFTVRDFPGEGGLHERVERYFQERAFASGIEPVREKILNHLSAEEDRIRRSLAMARETAIKKSDYKRFKEYGDLIMSGLTAIKKGDLWFLSKDFFHDDAPIEIGLDKDLSPVENAEHYYRAFKKAKGALARIDQETKDYEKRLAALGKQLCAVSSITDSAKLAEISKNLFQKKIQTTEKEIPGIVFFSNGFQIFVGRTALENDALLRHHVRGNDYWMHARDFPGSSVFIKSVKGKSIPLEVLLDAGNLALFYSKAKNSRKADFYYTQVKYLKKAKGGKPGLFLPTQEKNLTVKLDVTRIERLKSFSPINY